MKQMYKVFLNDRVIRICSRQNITNNQSTVSFDEGCTVKDISTWFRAFEAGAANEVSIVHQNPEKFFRLFQSAFKVVHAAGGVVVAGEKLLFIFRKDRWDLPKGKMEKNELAEDAALREVQEETGILPQSIDKRLPSTFHVYKSPYPDSYGEWIFKETYWFQMNYTGENPGTPQADEGITQVKWVSTNALDEVLSNTYENLKQVITLYRK